MKLSLKSNPIILWLWLALFVIAPILVFYLLFGEINLLGWNWIIAQNQNTPVFFYPVNQSHFAAAWSGWIQQLPSLYQEYFVALANEPSTTGVYVNGILTIDGVQQTVALGALFYYPFASVAIEPFLFFLAFLFIYVVSLVIYHIVCYLFWKQAILATDSYVFLFAFWFIGLVLFYSGAFPGFGGWSNRAWFVIIIRIIILTLALIGGVYLPFRLFNYLNYYFRQESYFNSLAAFKKEADNNKKTQINLFKKQPKNSVKLKSDK